MPPFLTNLLDYGVPTAALVIVAWIVSLIIQKVPNKTENETSKILREISSTLVAHNVRAAENHNANLAQLASMMHDHEKMMEYLTKLVMSISNQDTVMRGFQADVADIKCTLSQIKERQVTLK